MKRLTMLVAIIFTAVSSAAAVPIQWSGNGHYYDIIVSTNINWTNANAAASSQTFLSVQGHLATVTSAGEDNFIINNFDEFHKWLGGFQFPESPDHTSGWQWVTGEPWGYTNWAAGEPNSTGEDKLHYGVINTGVWNDFSDAPFLNGYVVEFDVVPEPRSVVLTGIGGAILAMLQFRRHRCSVRQDQRSYPA